MINKKRDGKIRPQGGKEMTKLERILRRIDTLRDEMVNFQIKLASIPAIAPVNGGRGENEKGHFLLGFLQENGFENIEVIKAPDLDTPEGYRPNIIGRFKGKSPKKTIWVMTHMDVVPPGDLAQWEGDPFKPWIKEGKIYGRGVEDNQQAMVASLFALKAFRAENLRPAHDVGLVLVSDEETGNLKGIDYVLRHTQLFQKNDLIIVPDAGNSEGTLIEVAEKSILWLKFRTIGKQAHGSTPEKGINSFKAASYFIVELDRLYKLFPEVDPLFEPPISTFEPTKKEANVPNINTIPGEDVFYLDSRILPRIAVEKVENAVNQLARGVEKKLKVKIQVEIQQKAPAAPPTSPRAAVVQALKKAVWEIYRKKASPRGIGGGTVAAFFRRAGFEAACWSRIDETAHQPNEYCRIENMVGDAKVFGHVFLQD